MKTLDVSDFPPGRDQTTARWWPIQFEPIPASGEFFTIGVAVVADKDSRVRTVPGLNKFRLLLGEDVRVIEEAARITLSSLQQHLHLHPQTSPIDFKPPFASVRLGKERIASGASIDGIVQQAISLSSAIAEPPETSLEIQKAATVQAPTLTESVRDIIVSRAPELSKSFEVPLFPSKSKKAPVLGFVSQQAIANFSLIGAARINAGLDRARTGMWALDLHRASYPEYRREVYRLYLQVPTQETSKKKVDELDEACREIQYEGSKKQLAVVIKDSAQSIANDLLVQLDLQGNLL
jgi:hypothetical protein